MRLAHGPPTGNVRAKKTDKKLIFPFFRNVHTEHRANITSNLNERGGG